MCCWTSSRTLGTRPRRAHPPQRAPRPRPGPATPARRRATGALASLLKSAEGLPGAGTIAHAAQFAGHEVLHPREALGKARSAAELILREELRGAPHTSLNDTIGTRRRFEVVSVPLADLKSIRGALGGTVNDVVLTLTASGLRALLVSRGEPLPEQGMRAMVPMNVRDASEHLALGNRISSLFVDLPLREPDLVRRYRETAARSEALKSDEQAVGSTAVLEIASLAPPVLHSALARGLYATRLFNLTITNVPGRQSTLYAFGAPLREVHPLVPLAADHAIGVAALSYDGTVFFGVVADPDRVPDLDVFIGAMKDSLEDLLAAAARPQPAAATANGGADAAQRRRHAAH